MGDVIDNSTDNIERILVEKYPGVEFRIKNPKLHETVISWWEGEVESLEVNQFVVDNSSLSYISSKSTEFGEYGIVRNLASYTYANRDE